MSAARLLDQIIPVPSYDTQLASCGLNDKLNLTSAHFILLILHEFVSGIVPGALLCFC
jgi:hypothetical protein